MSVTSLCFLYLITIHDYEATILTILNVNKQDCKSMAEASKPKLQITPKKYCCFLCGTHLPDAKRRARISSLLAHLLSDILECKLDTIDVRGYLCNDDCYKKINRFTMPRTSLAELSKTLKERNAAGNASMRCKRGFPSDVKETFASAQHLKSRNVVQSLNFQKIAPN